MGRQNSYLSDGNVEEKNRKAKIKLAVRFDASDPQPERDDSTFGGSQVAYRRAYRNWHAREQRRKKTAAARSVAPHRPMSLTRYTS